MLRPITLGTVALLGLMAGAAASADDRRQSHTAYYSSGPQVRLGLDVIWGGYGYAPPPPPAPVAFYPVYPVYPVYYPANRYDGPRYGRGHRKHHHGPHRGDD